MMKLIIKILPIHPRHEIDVATLRRCTLRKRQHTCMLLDVAAQIVRTQNIKNSKRKRYIMNSVTKRIASQNV